MTREPSPANRSCLWDDLDYAVQAYITDRWEEPEEDYWFTARSTASWTGWNAARLDVYAVLM